MNKKHHNSLGWILLVIVAIFSLVFALTFSKQTDSATNDPKEIQEEENKEQEELKEQTEELNEFTTKDTGEIEEKIQEISEESKQTPQEICLNIEFTDELYVEVNDNIPFFTKEDLVEARVSYEKYAQLDALGRCGACVSSVGRDLMPTEERGEIGPIRPSGWHTVKYDSINGRYLYNRCHLLAYQLTGENANEKNLITGTRSLNVNGMLPFENLVANYVKETGNHVLYRVTPIFEGDNLVAKGVLMEAESVEDQGEGILFNVFCFNTQPGIIIDYSSGNSYINNDVKETSEYFDIDDTDEGNQPIEDEKIEYVLNTNTHRIHVPTCDSVSEMKEKNKKLYSGSIDDLLQDGYRACKRCLDR